MKMMYREMKLKMVDTIIKMFPAYAKHSYDEKGLVVPSVMLSDIEFLLFS